MDQVFVVNPKGGCGKTTIATQLAAYYAAQGRRVLLADHDAQKSSSDWLASRPESCSVIRCCALKPEATLDTSSADIVVHDMPAAWGFKELRHCVQAGDRLLIPVLSSPTDIKACLRFIMSLSRDGLMDSDVRVGLIANKVRSNTNYFHVLEAFLERVELPLVGQVRDTQNYIRLMDKGLSLFDFQNARLKRYQGEWQPIVQWLALS
ncbi:ParA family protein [Agaribacterium sp. ZY112]|uniref:ParA family protein n=1 Tax=Agaribacterium sp. ZY112 TaxID=3233574 RepID=UPI0035247EBE